MRKSATERQKTYVQKHKRMLGKRIKTMREKQGLTQVELAAEVGVNVAQVVRWEKGSAIPGADSLLILAKILKVSMDWLGGLVDDPEKHLEIEDLSPDERKLIEAYRRGDWQRVLYELATSEELLEKSKE